jgi:hypothetical protein
MSDAQLEKLKTERDMLARERQLLQSAMPKQKAAEKLMETMKGSVDPFHSPDNEWSRQPDAPGCCSIQ